MARIKSLNINEAAESARKQLEGVEKKLGTAPNVMKTMAHSPAVLDAYLAFSGSLGKGSLSTRLREQIALAVGQANGCQYCLSAHSALGRLAGLKDDDIVNSRRGTSSDPKSDAALKFAQKIVVERGRVNDGDIQSARDAGLDDTALVEIVANVAVNLFTNYLNHVADAEIDFPEAENIDAQPACAC